MAEPFATRHFWRVIAGSVVVGLISAVCCLVFLALEHAVTGRLWGEGETPMGYFSGSWSAVAIVLAAAVAVGLLRRWMTIDGADPNFIAEMVEGRVPWQRGFQFGALGLVSLVGGASVGPEAPLGTVGGAIGTAVGDRIEPGRPETTEDLTYAGISGVFGGLGVFPFAGPIMASEVNNTRWQAAPHRLLPGIVSATAAVAVLYPTVGTPFLDLYDLGTTDLEVRWILLAVAFGVAGAVLGTLTLLVMGVSARLANRVTDPLLRATVSGVVIAAIGYALPLTLFSGRDQLTGILAGGAGVSVSLLAAVIVGKIVTFTLSMRWGFFGGPIFPLIFMGAVCGTLVHVAIPSVPLHVAAPAMAAAVAVAVVPLPLMVMVFTTMMFGLQLELGVIPAVAVVTSFVLVQGTGVVTRLQSALMSRSSGPPPPGLEGGASRT
ncbi:MAG: chloride channel protein [Acidimicrobiales bacterium]